MLIFTARHYASAVYNLYGHVSVCLSVYVRCSTKTAKRRIIQTSVDNSLGNLLFWSQISWYKATGVTLTRGAKCRWSSLNAVAVAANWRLSTQSVVNLVRSQVITLSVHIFYLQHVHRYAARRVCLLATADPCLKFGVSSYLWNRWSYVHLKFGVQVGTGWVIGVTDLFNFWEITDNCSEMAQDGDTVTMEDRW